MSGYAAAGAEAANLAWNIYSQLWGPAAQQARNQNKLAMANLQNQLAQQEYIKQVTALQLQRSTSGYTDSEGNQYSYDPSTNTWKQTMGPVPAEVQRAGEQASITRNVVDQARAMAANDAAARAAAAAAPQAEAARAPVVNFQPRSAADLTNLLTQQIVKGTNLTNQPIIDSTLREAIRTGTSAAPVMQALMRESSDQQRKAIMDATIGGITGTGQANQAMLAPLVSRMQALSGGTTPQLQYPGIDTTSPNNALLAAVTQRAGGAGGAGAQGQASVAGSMDALNRAAGAVPVNPLSAGMLSIGQQIQALANNKDFMKTVGGMFGDTSSGATNQLNQYSQTGIPDYEVPSSGAVYPTLPAGSQYTPGTTASGGSGTPNY